MLACKVFHFSFFSVSFELLPPSATKAEGGTIPPSPPAPDLHPSPLTQKKTLMLCFFKVANVKKETTFHWYKEDDEIVPESPPNVMSGTCALPLPLV